MPASAGDRPERQLVEVVDLPETGVGVEDAAEHQTAVLIERVGPQLRHVGDDYGAGARRRSQRHDEVS
jgi:hypothetical protein